MRYTISCLYYLYLCYLINAEYNWENNLDDTELLYLSDQCADGQLVNVFVPLGVGAPDALVLIVSHKTMDKFPKCNITFSIAQEESTDLQILVIEILNSVQEKHEIIEHCKGENGTGYLILTTVEPADGTVIHVCDHLKYDGIGLLHFVHVSYAKRIQLEVKAVNAFHSMKITHTAGRALMRHEYCNESHEVQCILSNASLCIHKALSCDKNINCGAYNLHDEEYKVCRVFEYVRFCIVALAALVTFILVFVIFVFLLKTYISKISDNFFIFNEHEDNKLVIKRQLTTPVGQKLMGEFKDTYCLCHGTANKDGPSPASVHD